MILKFFLGLAAFALALAAAAADTPVIPIAQHIAGQTQSQWTRAWWQWAASFTTDESPVADPTGERCAAGQQGAVWFLAGTFGTHRVIRHCVVPAGKYLFFPLVNVVVTPPAGEVATCAGVTEIARGEMDERANLVLRIDGQVLADLESQRIASADCFDLGLRAVPPIRIFPVAADGFYVMLRPLAPGRHVIDFGGMSPLTTQAVSYTIEVR